MNYFTWDTFNNDITALTTTKHFGNMAYQIKDEKELIKLRRNKLAQDLKLNPDHVIFTYQNHSDNIEEVTVKDIKKGMDDFESGVPADALYTTDSSLAIGVFHADCAPIFIYAPKAHLVAIIHASFKSTLKHITFKTISLLKNKYHLNGEDIFVNIGPYQHFIDLHVNEDDVKAYIKAFMFSNNQKFIYIFTSSQEDFLSQDNTSITNSTDESNAFNTDYYGGSGQTGKDTATGDTTTTNKSINNKDKTKNFYDVADNYLFRQMINTICETFIIDEEIK